MNCECGCGLQAPVYRGKQCRYLRGHCGAQKARKKIRHVVEQGTGCWIWLLGMRDGYGIEKVDGKYGGAHVHSYEKHRGPVPDGMVLDHAICKNRRCINPWHLEIVTSAVNTRRGRNAKINQEMADEIRRMKACGTTQREIARVFGVSEGLVSDVVLGNTWKTERIKPELTKTSVPADTAASSADRLNAPVVAATTTPGQLVIYAAIPLALMGSRNCRWSSLEKTSAGRGKDWFRGRARPLPNFRGPPIYPSLDCT